MFVKLLLTLFIAFFSLIPNVHAIEQVSPCITYDNQKPIHITKVDLSCPSIKLIGTLPQHSDTTSNFARDNEATVAINGAFYDEKRNPLGLNYSHQHTWHRSKDYRQYAFFACTKNNQCFIESYNKSTIYQPQWDLVISGWQSLQNGKFLCAPSSTGICYRNAQTKHPRTAIGLTADNRFLYMVVVEGRREEFQGYTLTQLATLFKQLNVPHAINLDGGGSSTMIINHNRVNALPDNQLFFERSVANHLGIKDEKK
ncbi:phosphodiester glycosidase family protein [Pelistega sp. MC2]|uniref:phosphodiester glycosidase family protein n=1 Tax=Pelistega sp. MC2 TaxID=1720297 RepID=UPI0008DA35E0|nr:phosphodiester glycosidase family protein [Pelistega sp. MC2]